MSVLSLSLDDHRLISSSPTKIDCLGSQLLKYLRIKSLLLAERTSVSTEPSVSTAEHLGPS